ncbi:MAG: Zn-ribbon domain-containing OB-fold protein [Dehalococcoidia bacterium]
MTQTSEGPTESVDPHRLRLPSRGNESPVLLGTRCRECGVCVFGPAIFCQSCTSSSLEPVELSREGTLFSYTTVRVPPAGWPGPVPYVLGEVELPEGPHVLAEVIDCADAELKIGLPVQLALQTVEGVESGVARVVYKWRPLETSPAPGAK